MNKLINEEVEGYTTQSNLKLTILALGLFTVFVGIGYVVSLALAFVSTYG